MLLLLFQSDVSKDFFLLLAICNTVIVAKQPHHDQMNSSGIVSPQAAIEEDHHPLPTNQIHLQSLRSEHISEDPSQSNSSSLAPLQPDPSLKRQKDDMAALGDHRFKSKHLQLPGLFGRAGKQISPSSGLHLGSSFQDWINKSAFHERPIYEAESPDELSLVDAAYAYKYMLVRRSPKHVTVSIPGKKSFLYTQSRNCIASFTSLSDEGLVDYAILHVLPFDSTRKRMSIIVSHPHTKEKIVYCKGADSAILPQLNAATDNAQDVIERTERLLETYAKQGLRVLVMAKRILSDDEYNEWREQHHEAEVLQLHHFSSSCVSRYSFYLE